MTRNALLLLALAPAVAACGPNAPDIFDGPAAEGTARFAQAAAQGLDRRTIPDEDPGPPLYARVTPITNQFLHDGEWIGIPFYRDPACVPDDFDLLALFHFPGPEGPGAFGCPLRASGFLLIERDAPLGTFPRQVVLTSDELPFRFVPWAEFQAAAAGGSLTMAGLQALQPLAGTAHRFHETLDPRLGEHRVVIDAEGTLDDGRAFQFHVTHIGDRLVSARIRFR